MTNISLLVYNGTRGDASLQHVVLGVLSVKQNLLNSGWFVVSKRSTIHTLFHEPCIFSPVATKILPVEIAMKRSSKVKAIEWNYFPLFFKSYYLISHLNVILNSLKWLYFSPFALLLVDHFESYIWCRIQIPKVVFDLVLSSWMSVQFGMEHGISVYSYIWFRIYRKTWFRSKVPKRVKYWGKPNKVQ